MLSGRSQSNGCAVAWVTIARDSEFEYHFILWGDSTGFVEDTYGVRCFQVKQI